jgi:hypothetical protein
MIKRLLSQRPGNRYQRVLPTVSQTVFSSAQRHARFTLAFHLHAGGTKTRAAALQWAQQIPNADNRAIALHEVITRWADNDPP